jgi:nitrate/nitrite transporter NarK
MLIFGGMILDKMGVKFTGLMATCIMIVGVFIKWFGISHTFDGATVSILGSDWKLQLLVASLGYATFGVGVEIAGITVSKIIVKWFKGKEMALAMGLEMATARIGTGLAIGVTPFLSRALGNSISKPIFVGLILLCIGLLSFITFVVMDTKRDKQDAAEATDEDKEEPFRVRDILDIIKLKGFWYVALLCVLFYSAVFPFLKYAPNLMINKFGISQSLSGLIPSILPFGTILLTPFFGNLYDRKGKGATIMVIGAIMLVFIHAMFSIPFLDNWLIALFLVVLLGIAFSLVPSAMWPSVPKIIPENKLGTAYALIFWVQNWGLMGVPYLIGKVLNAYCQTGITPEGKPTFDYTLPMIIFTCFGILALVISLLLKREDRIKGYGLEQPNIKK